MGVNHGRLQRDFECLRETLCLAALETEVGRLAAESGDAEGNEASKYLSSLPGLEHPQRVLLSANRGVRRGVILCLSPNYSANPLVGPSDPRAFIWINRDTVSGG